MKLGILVNTSRHLEAVLGITRAALRRGHEMIFTMDEGVRLFAEPRYRELCKLQGVKMSFCDHNAVRLGLDKGPIPAEVVCGSQYDNALMNHECDKVLVL